MRFTPDLASALAVLEASDISGEVTPQDREETNGTATTGYVRANLEDALSHAHDDAGYQEERNAA